jgi:hypothetical protein
MTAAGSACVRHGRRLSERNGPEQAPQNVGAVKPLPQRVVTAKEREKRSLTRVDSEQGSRHRSSPPVLLGSSPPAASLRYLVVSDHPRRIPGSYPQGRPSRGWAGNQVIRVDQMRRLVQMRELLPSLLKCQDAPDGGPRRVWVALAFPPLRVLLRRCRVRVVPLKAMTFSPSLNAVFALFCRGLRITDPAALSTHCVFRFGLGPAAYRSAIRRGGPLGGLPGIR